MTDQREGPRFIVDESGNVRDVRQTGYRPSQPPPGKPPGNGREGQSSSRSPQRSGVPYLIPIPIGLICWLVIALIRGCDAPEKGPYPSPPPSDNVIRSPVDFSDFSQGSQAYFLGEYEAAIRHFTAALDSHRPVGEVYNRRALAYHAKGEYEKALQDYELALLGFEQALSLNSGPAMVHNNRACTYIALGEYDQAKDDLEQAIDLQSTLGKAYYNLGLVHSSLGEYAAAIEYLGEALSYPAPDSLSPLLCVARIQRPIGVIGGMREADEIECRFLETGADAPSVLYQRALTYQAQGEVDSALGDLEEAIKLLLARHPRTTPLPLPTESAPFRQTPAVEAEENRIHDPRVDLPSVYYLKALVCTEKGEYDQAAEDLDKALALGLDSDDGKRLSHILTALGAGSQ